MDVERHKTVHRKRFPGRKEMISRVFLTCKKVSSVCCNGTFTTLNIILSEAVVTCLVKGIACKAILSEAFVTRDTVPGPQAAGRLSVRQYLVTPQIMARYCLTGWLVFNYMLNLSKSKKPEDCPLSRSLRAVRAVCRLGGY